MLSLATKACLFLNGSQRYVNCGTGAHIEALDTCERPDNRLVQIHPAVNVPVNAILVISALAVIIALINLGSTTAFNIVTSLGTGTLTISYIICITIIIWRKLAGEPLLPSRFNMGRVFGLCVNVVALGWLCLVFVIAFFPSVPAPLLTVAGMNWSVVVFLAVVLFSAVYFVVWGRKRYVGPVEYVRKLD